MRYLVCKGTPYEIGLQHGRALAADIRRCRDAYCRFQDLDPSLVRQTVLDMEQRHRPAFPNLIEEMHGIADGAELPYLDILKLNFSLDVLGLGAPRCSNLGVMDTPAGALIAKTIDLPDVERDFLFIQQVIPQSGSSYVHYATAGTVWSEAGLSESGLAHVGSGLLGKGYRSDGMCIWFLTSLASLASYGRVSEALDFLLAHEVAGLGQTLLLADAEGDLAMVEMLPGAKAVRRSASTDQPLLHTNHPLDPATRAVTAGEDGARHLGYAGLVKDSEERYANLTEIARMMPHSYEGLRDALQNHGDVGAICRHGRAGCDTIAGVIIVPGERILWGTMGFPCREEFRCYFPSGTPGPTL